MNNVNDIQKLVNETIAFKKSEGKPNSEIIDSFKLLLVRCERTLAAYDKVVNVVNSPNLSRVPIEQRQVIADAIKYILDTSHGLDKDINDIYNTGICVETSKVSLELTITTILNMADYRYVQCSMWQSFKYSLCEMFGKKLRGHFTKLYNDVEATEVAHIADNA